MFRNITKDEKKVRLIMWAELNTEYGYPDTVLRFMAMFRNFMTFSYFVGIPPDMTKKVKPEFRKMFIRAYLERLTELDGQAPASVTELEVDRYFVWSSKCELVSTWTCLLTGKNPH